MNSEITPLFIVGCGRSGTQSLARLFEACPDMTMHHEYMIHVTQPLGVEWHAGLVDKSYVASKLNTILSRAFAYSETPYWGDCSNKLSWFVEVLADLYPNAKFIHLVRDGRKVVSSLYHKLGHECLDDASTQALQRWLKLPDGVTKPPAEKKYWWPQPNSDEPFAADYNEFSQFERICYHWAQINRVVRHQLTGLPSERWRCVRLEDLTSDRQELHAMLNFTGQDMTEEHVELMVKPHNVIRPENRFLTEEESDQFWRVASDEMRVYGYENLAEYELQYDGANSRLRKTNHG